MKGKYIVTNVWKIMNLLEEDKLLIDIMCSLINIELNTEKRIRMMNSDSFNKLYYLLLIV